MATAERVWNVVEPYVAAEHLELDDLQISGNGRSRTLRVVVDAEGGVDVDRLAAVSRGLSRLLDAETDLSGPYRLEVTSPGLERVLRRPRHFEKAIGMTVTVKVAGAGERETLRGVLSDVDDSGIKLDTDDRRIGFVDIVEARTVFEWKPGPKPGGGRR